MFDLVFSIVTYQRLNLSAFSSIVVGPGLLGTPTRRNTVTVANPTALFIRKDGTVTIQGANKANTVSLSVSGRPIVLTDYNGEQQTFFLR